jgi:hypothetical protein
MSWFTLQDQPVRKKRKGIWVRFHSNPDVVEAVRKAKLMRPMDAVEWVSIHELRSDGKVMLEVWCISLVDTVRGKHRHNVFHVTMDENPEWVCEGDLGRGLK